MSKIKLSILICSLVERDSLLKRLLGVLENQRTEEVEILINTDNKQISTGMKRNKLLESSCGEYISFVDDDDLVSDDYITRIFEAIKTSPDCVGIEGIMTDINSGKKNMFIHSLQYKSWFTKNGIYYRCPNHLSPVKRNLALKAGFPNITVSEDHEYSKKLLPFLKTEVYIDIPIYYYLFNSKKK